MFEVEVCKFGYDALDSFVRRQEPQLRMCCHVCAVQRGLEIPCGETWGKLSGVAPRRGFLGAHEGDRNVEIMSCISRSQYQERFSRKL